MLARANNSFAFKDRGGQGDAIANMTIAEQIVAANPLPEPTVQHQPAVQQVLEVPRGRGRGRPSKRRRGNVGISSEI